MCQLHSNRAVKKKKLGMWGHRTTYRLTAAVVGFDRSSFREYHRGAIVRRCFHLISEAYHSSASLLGISLMISDSVVLLDDFCSCLETSHFSVSYWMGLCSHRDHCQFGKCVAAMQFCCPKDSHVHTRTSATVFHMSVLSPIQSYELLRLQELWFFSVCICIQWPIRASRISLSWASHRILLLFWNLSCWRISCSHPAGRGSPPVGRLLERFSLQVHRTHRVLVLSQLAHWQWDQLSGIATGTCCPSAIVGAEEVTAV